MAHDHGSTPVHLRDPAQVRKPNYARTAQALSDADLEDEILSRRGEPDYQLALLHEWELRGKEALT